MASLSRFRLLSLSAFLIIIICIIALSFERPRAVISELQSPFWPGSKHDEDVSNEHGGGDIDSVDGVDGVIIDEGLWNECPVIANSDFDFKESKHEYTRAVIRPRFPAELEYSRFTTLEAPLLPPFDPSPEAFNDRPCDVTTLDILSDPSSTNLIESKILFGYATKVERIHRFLDTVLATIGPYASAVGLVGPESSSFITEAETELQSLGLNITLYPSNLRYTTEYFSLINTFANYTDTHSWFVYLDDDTFLPNTLPLIAERLSHLDPNKPYFIGSPSDSALQTFNHGGWAHGGGGIILSAFTVSQISKHFDECVAEYSPDIEPLGGDHRIFLCAQIAERYLPDYDSTGAGVLSNLTVWPELKQWDIGGPAEGIFEGGLRFWSWHHWVSTHWFDSPSHALKSASVTENAGIHSLLRRWVFNETEFMAPDGRVGREYFVLTNGYSIVKYHIPDIDAVKPEDIDLLRVEYTWDDEAWYFLQSQGETRPRLSELEGVEATRWRLRDVEVGERGELRQFYWVDRESTKKQGDGERAVERRDDEDQEKDISTKDSENDDHDDHDEQKDIESMIEIVWLWPDDGNGEAEIHYR